MWAAKCSGRRYIPFKPITYAETQRRRLNRHIATPNATCEGVARTTVNYRVLSHTAHVFMQLRQALFRFVSLVVRTALALDTIHTKKLPSFTPASAMVWSSFNTLPEWINFCWPGSNAGFNAWIFCFACKPCNTPRKSEFHISM